MKISWNPEILLTSPHQHGILTGGRARGPFAGAEEVEEVAEVVEGGIVTARRRRERLRVCVSAIWQSPEVRRWQLSLVRTE